VRATRATITPSAPTTMPITPTVLADDTELLVASWEAATFEPPDDAAAATVVDVDPLPEPLAGVRVRIGVG
jgi:hypothetical protein